MINALLLSVVAEARACQAKQILEDKMIIGIIATRRCKGAINMY